MIAHVDGIEGRKAGELQALVNTMTLGGKIVLGKGTHEGFTVPAANRGITIEGESREWTRVGAITVNAGQTRICNLNAMAGNVAHGIKIHRTTALLEHCVLDHVNIGSAGGATPGGDPTHGLILDGPIMFEAHSCSFLWADTACLHVLDSGAFGTVNLQFFNCGFNNSPTGRGAHVTAVVNVLFSGCDFEGNRILTGGTGAFLQGTQLVEFRGCNFEDNGTCDNVIQADTSQLLKVEGCNIIGTSLPGNALRGILLQTSSGAHIERNVFSGMDQYAILADVNSANCDFRGNATSGLVVELQGPGSRQWP